MTAKKFKKFLNNWDWACLMMDHSRKEVKVKLPKQWKDWCKKCGLRAMNSGFKFGKFKKRDYFVLKGKGRNWRVNCDGEFQCSERYVDFDRWASSHQESERMPLSFSEFRITVELLTLRMERFEYIQDQQKLFC